MELLNEVCIKAKLHHSEARLSESAAKWCCTQILSEEDSHEPRLALKGFLELVTKFLLTDGPVSGYSDFPHGEDQLSRIRGHVQQALAELSPSDRESIFAWLDGRIKSAERQGDFRSLVSNLSSVFDFPHLDPYRQIHLNTQGVDHIGLPPALRTTARYKFELLLVPYVDLNDLRASIAACFEKSDGSGFAIQTSPRTFPKSHLEIDDFLRSTTLFNHAYYYAIRDCGRTIGIINCRGISLGESGGVEGTFGTVIFDPQDRRQGKGQLAKALLFDALFQAGIQTLYTKVLHSNIGAARSLLQMGLRSAGEGTDPEGRPYDLFSLSALEWAGIRESVYERVQRIGKATGRFNL